MRLPPSILTVPAALLLALLAGPTNAIETDPFWSVICHSDGTNEVTLASASGSDAAADVPPCGPTPAVFHELPVVGHGADTAVTLRVGFDVNNSHLCFVNHVLQEAPVLRVGAGHQLTINLTNTLRDTGMHHEQNCAIQNWGGENFCLPQPQFAEAPGPDGPFYPLMANEAHMADGTVNLHVHGLFVSPQPCSDEVLRSTIYPINWAGPVAPMQPCQTAKNQLTYTYDLPADHPAGLYWYHTHRHGQSEQETQMGLVGAIIVEDAGDTYRRSLGVTDEVLVINDTPLSACTVSGGVECDGPNQPATATPHTLRQANRQAARQAARQAVANAAVAFNASAASTSSNPVLDPRIDQVDQAGGCAQGAQDATGGQELWTLTLNGAPVQDNPYNGYPPDSALLSKTMQPGQRQIFRIVNASADSFIAPQIVLSQNGVETIQPLEVFARDGVGLADRDANRHIGIFDVSTNPLIVPPAGRIELVVHAPPVGAKLYLQSAQVNPGCGGNAYPGRRLLLVTPSGTPMDPGAADDSDLISNTVKLHNYLKTLDAPPTVHRTIVLAEYGRDFTYGITKWNSGPPTAADFNPALTDFYIPEVASDDGEVDPSTTALRPFNAHNLAAQIVVHLHGQDSVTEEWLVENSTLEIHAFHIHQIHFRDITVNSTNPDLQPVLDTDVLPAAPLIGDPATGYPGAPGWIRLRMTFTKADIGEFVFHCHILEHEDSGMMGKVQVVAN
jgi:FtsP/CotA-like multicopper oxidase with cupredoxin domain